MAAILSGLLTTGCSVFGIRTASEPAYTTERTIGPLEIRRYAPRVAADTTVDGDEIRARRVGFERLAGYIFGGNGTKRAIAMTAPVDQAAGGSGRWRIRFFMPAGETLATLPPPESGSVTLVTVPAETVAVLRFGGTPTKAAVHAAEARLIRGVADAGLVAEGAPIASFYDPPWTIPPLRRNEVSVRLAPPSGSGGT